MIRIILLPIKVYFLTSATAGCPDWCCCADLFEKSLEKVFHKAFDAQLVKDCWPSSFVIDAAGDAVMLVVGWLFDWPVGVDVDPIFSTDICFPIHDIRWIKKMYIKLIVLKRNLFITHLANKEKKCVYIRARTIWK